MTRTLATLTAEVAELSARVTELTERLGALELAPPIYPTPTSPTTTLELLVSSQASAINALQSQVAALSSTPASSSSEPSIPSPPRFNGIPTATSQFAFLVSNAIEARPLSFRSDAQKVGYVLALLDGAAATWGHGYKLSHPSIYSDFPTFWSA